MDETQFYEKLKNRFRQVVEENNLMEEAILVTGRPLTTEEAIGSPQRHDFPIVKGKEKLMQADFKGAKGQAFSDMPDSFSGTLREVVERPLQNNFDRAVLVSTLNAVLRYLGKLDNTIHCKNEQPEECAQKLVTHIKEKYNDPLIALIGLQPAMLERLAANFKVRAVDLDPDNIGQNKFGVLIENVDKTDEIIAWSDLILATGSTVANGSMPRFIGEKPVIFYGTTGAGAAYLMDLTRFCAFGS